MRTNTHLAIMDMHMRTSTHLAKIRVLEFMWLDFHILISLY